MQVEVQQLPQLLLEELQPLHQLQVSSDHSRHTTRAECNLLSGACCLSVANMVQRLEEPHPPLYWAGMPAELQHRRPM